MPPSHPLRTAIVGLSSTAKTSWAATAHLPNLLLEPQGRERFHITALLNSSLPAATAAIEAFSLDPSTTKAYGSPADLATDPDIDLVIVNTRVDRHRESALAAIATGKDVYIEWPIAANWKDIEEILATARASKSRVAVGLQGRWAPPITKLREVVASGEYGKLLSARFEGFGGTIDRAILPTGLKYFAERSIGGNPVTIGFGHTVDFVQAVVGDLDPSTTHARLQIQRPKIPVRDPGTMKIVEEIESDVPDLVSVHGRLKPSKHVVDDATLTGFFRRGQPFPGKPAFTFSLVFEKAEVLLTSPSGVAIQASSHTEPVTIQAHNFATNEVTDIAWTWNETQLEVPIPARSVQTTLFAFADGNDDGWASLESAAARAKQIDEWLQQDVVRGV